MREIFDCNCLDNANRRLAASFGSSAPISGVSDAPAQTAPAVSQAKLSWQESKAEAARQRKKANDLKKLEASIEELENRIAEIDEQFLLPENATNVGRSFCHEECPRVMITIGHRDTLRYRRNVPGRIIYEDDNTLLHRERWKIPDAPQDKEGEGH